MARLDLREEGGRKREFELRSVVSIGRQSTNEIQVQTEEASRVHARIFPAGRSFVLEDLRSSNGTFVNGQRVARRILADGDRIRIGGVEILFREEAPSDRLEGELLGGAYRILSLIGRGGMGAVYRALQISMDRVVALKILHRDLTRDREFVVQFLNEARTAGQLSHPNIIHVYDFGEHGGIYYFSMEYVEGESLQDVLDREGKLPAERTLEMLLGVTRALAHAHGHRIIHRDVKPRNVMIDRAHADAIKLADLGLAKVIGRDRIRQKAGPVMGTPHYMAPEIAQGRDADERSDLYSLGATAFRALTGRVPFEGNNSIEVLTKHVKAPVPDPRALDVTIPPPVSDLVRRLMAKTPTARPASAAGLIEEIERVRSGLAKRFEKDRERRASLKEIKPRPRARLRARRRRRSVFWPLAAVVLALAAGVLGRELLRREGPGNEILRLRGEAQERIQIAHELARREEYNAAQEKLDEALRILAKAAPDAPEVKEARKLKDHFDRERVAVLKHHMDEAFAVVKTFALRNGEAKPEEARARIEDFIRGWPGSPHLAEARALLAGLQARPDEEGPRGADADAERRAHEAWLRARQEADLLERREKLTEAVEAVRGWLAAHPGAADAAEAQERLRALDELRRIFLGELWKGAEGAIKAQEWTAANRYCTRLITQDPKGEWGQKGRKALDEVRGATEKIYNQALGRAAAKVAAFKFTEPVLDLLKVRGELLGTPWVERINREIEEIRLLGEAHERLKHAIHASRGKPKLSPFLVENPMTGAKERRRMVGASADGLRLEIGQAVIPHPWSKLTPEDLAALHRLFPPKGAGHLAAGLLFARCARWMKNEEERQRALSDAERELNLATREPETAEVAERHLARLTGRLNLRSYAFEDGLDLLDFEMKGGDWDHREGQLVQRAAGEAEAVLAKGTWRAHELRVSLDVSLSAPRGFLSIELRQDEANSVIFTLDPKAGCAILATVGGAPVSKRGVWRPPTDKPLRVRCAVKDKALILSVEGTERVRLEAPDVKGLTVHCAVRTRDMPCAIDRLELLNAAE